MKQIPDSGVGGQVIYNEAMDEDTGIGDLGVYGYAYDTSSGLVWGYYGGRWGGFPITASTVTLTDNATNYLVVAIATGVLTKATTTTNWNNSTDYSRVYKITTVSGVVTAVESHRAGPGGVLGAVGSGGSGVSGLTGLTFTSDTGSTADSDPGNGLFKWNNATEASATFLYFDNQTLDAISLTTFFASLGANGFIYLEQQDDPSKWQKWKWTAVTAGSGYYKFAVALQANGGTIADNKTVLCDFDSNGAAATGTVGKHAVPVVAGGIRPSAAGGCAPLAIVASGSNQPDIVTLDFDATTEEYAQFAIPMPKSWNEGTLTALFMWSHTATTTNFGTVWGIQAVAVSDDDTIAASFGTAQTVTDTGGTTNDLYVSAETSAFTVGGTPVAGDMVFFRVYRKAADGSDTMAIDARLHSVVVFMTTDAENDA